MIAVTAASSHLGHHTIEALLARGIPGEQIVAIARNPQKASDLAERGVQVRQADYRQPDSLRAALQGVDKLVFISSGDLNDRVTQHRNVVNAARDAGVKLIAYTSILGADRTTMLLAKDHQATEALIRESGLPFVFLRNGWYIENYTATLAQTLQHGAMLGSAGNSRFNPATRRDYAEAAAAVVASDGHENTIYELGGDEAISMSELAAEFSRQSGKPVAYKDMPVEEYARTLASFGLPEPAAQAYADGDAAIARGELATDSGDLRKLIGHPTTRISDAIGEALNG